MRRRSSTPSQLRVVAEQIKNETEFGGNTAERVGDVLLGIIENLGTPTLAEPLSSMANIGATPDDSGKTLYWNGESWEYRNYYTGGGTGGVDEDTFWGWLGSNTHDKQISASFLSTALSNYVSRETLGNYLLTNSFCNNYSWWGNKFGTGSSINGTLTFSNGVKITPEGNSLKVWKEGNTPASLFATGSISALGTSSGSGGGGGGDFNALLDSLSASTVSTDNIDDGNIIMWDDDAGEWTIADPEAVQLGTLLTALKNISGTPSNGDVIQYNNGWGFAQVSSSGGSGSVTSVGMAAASDSHLTVSGTNPITSSGTIIIGVDSSYTIPTAQSVTNSTTAYNALFTAFPAGGYANDSALGVLYALDGYFDKNGVVSEAVRAAQLKTTRYLWGNEFNGTQNVTGNIGFIFPVQSDSYAESDATWDDSNPKTVLGVNTTWHNIHLGYKSRQAGYGTTLQGKSISFTTDDTENGVDAAEFTESGMLHIKQATEGLRIGNGLLTWDAANDSFKVEKYTANGRVAANLYATGGVSALGFSPVNGTSEVSNLKVTDKLQTDKLQIDNAVQAKDSENAIKNVLNTSSSESSGTTTDYLSIGGGWTDANHDTIIRGNKIHLNTGTSGDIHYAITLYANGDAQFRGDVKLSSGKKFYLDSSCYLFVDNGVLKFYNGSSTKTVKLED